MNKQAKIDMIGSLLYIDNKEGKIVPFKFNRLQRYFHLNKGSRNVILKYRQGGCSSSILGDQLTDCILYPNTQCAVVSHETRATQRLLDRVQFFYDSMEEPKPQIGAESRSEKTFPEMHSTIYIGTAGCLHPDSRILLEGGHTKTIKDASVGDVTYRGRGRGLEKVTQVFPQSYSGKMLKFTARGNPATPLIVTPDHKFRIHKGWNPAEKIATPLNSRGKRVCYFIKPVKHTVKSIEGLETDYELGWIFGLYLAEGWYGGAYTSFGLNSNETVFRDKIKSFAEKQGFKFRWRLKGGIGANGMEVSIGSISFMRVIEKIFGKKKEVPDWFWDCGENFLNGIIDGYVAGDGSEGFDKRGRFRSKVTSVRPHLLFQLRDMLLSVREIYSGIYKLKENRSGLGKTHKVPWELDFPLERGIKFHKYKKSSRSKQFYKYISIPIKVEEINYSGLVYDISCGGSFSTPSCLVHNSRAFGHGDTIKKALLSELALYPPEDAERILNGVEDAVPITGELTIECTAQGEDNKFYEVWSKAREGKSPYKAFFFPWWWEEGYQIAKDSNLALPEDKGDLIYTSDEKELVEAHSLTEAQIRWRRWKTSEKGALFFSQYPENEVDCWLVMGDPVFEQSILSQLALGCYEGKKHESGWSYWLAPEEKLRYIIGVDTASGAPGGSYSAACVLNDRYEVCATLQIRAEPHIFAGLLRKLGMWYNTAELVIERNFTGYAVLEQLMDYPNIANQRDFTSGRVTNQRGWWSNEQTRTMMMTIARDSLGKVKIWDSNLVRQLRGYRYVRLKTKYREEPQTHDDLAIGFMLALAQKKVVGTARGYRGSYNFWGW